MTLLVRNAGLATREVVTAGATLDDDALARALGRRRTGRLAPRPGAWTTSFPPRPGARSRFLDELRIAHQQIDPETVALVSGEVGFVDFGDATVAPDAHGLATDRAQLLMTSVSLVGSERALSAAVAAIRDGVAALLPYLQSAAFGPSLHRALKDAEVDVDDFGREPPRRSASKRPSSSSSVATRGARRCRSRSSGSARTRS